MKNFLRFIVFALLFSFFGCSGSVDENLYSSVSFEITIPESIGEQDSKIARNVSTENLKLVVSLEIEGLDKILSKEKNVSPGDTVTISFDELPVESNIRVKGELSNADEVLLYSGESEWQKILAGKNSVDLKMKKVITEDDTEGGDNAGEGDNTEGGDNTGEGGNTEGGGDNAGEGDNTEGGDNTGEGDNTEGDDNTGEGDNTESGDTGESEEIINAANPSIVTRPTNIDLLYGLDTENPVLQISAKSEDGGVVSFQWQVKNASGEWEDVESTTTENATLFNCSLTVPLDSISLNETKAYKCIVKNTNETVNGIKTAFVEVPVDVSLKQGTVLSFDTEYSGTYELYGKEFGSSENKDYSSIKIVEYYTRPNGNQESRTITFDKTRYSITAVPNAVGYVPYTITNLTSKATSEVKVLVKYSLENATVSVLNSSGSSESCIAQYTGTEELTANIELPSSDSESNGILLYSSTETTAPSNFLINENVKVAWSAGTVGESQLSVVVDNTESKTYKATVTPKEDTSWCVGEIVSNEYSVTVEPWKIELNNSEFIDGKYVIDIAAEQCALLVTNSAYPEPTVTFESKNNKFNIDENVVHISTSENTIEDVIIAKVDNKVIGRISVILPGVTNAAAPVLVGDFESKELIYPVDTVDPILDISAKSTDGGVITFQWQVKNASGEWENVEVTNSEPEGDVYTSILTVPLSSFEINETKTYKCIVTNTNENANGTKTSSIEKEATIKYVEGSISGVTAKYEGDYELYGSEFFLADGKIQDFSKIKITETYKSSSGKTGQRTVDFNQEDYTISDGKNAVGYVPYTITNLTSKATSEVKILVKYSLDNVTVSVLSSSGSSESCIAQYTGTEELTANIELPSSDSESNGILFYSSRETTTPSNFLINENVKVAWSAGTVGESQLSVVVDNTKSKTYKATVTPKEDTSWCVGEIVSNEYSVTVEPWKIEINNSEFIDGKYVIDINAMQCELSATNSAYPEPTVTFESENNKFNVDGNVVVINTSENAIEDVIIAKVDNKVIGSISVILPGITNAAAPVLVEDLESIELISPVATTDPVLDIVAKSTDGGVITFQWQVKNASGEWEDVEATGTEQATPMYSSILTVPLSSFDINETKTYKCIVTNTNENANGTKTSSIEKEATIKYVEGSISGVTAKYDGDYELYGSEFFLADGKKQDFSKIKITETYKSSSGKTGQRTVDFNQEDYTISDGKNAVGYVPYTIGYANKNLTADVRVPVKYKISSDEIWINHSSSGTIAEDSGKIEFIKDSENCSLDVSFNVDSIKLQVYKTVDSTETEMYYCDENEVAVEWNQGTEVEGNPFAISVDVSTVNEQTYTAKISPKNDGWLVCDDGSISLSKTVSIIESSVITEPDGTQENPFTKWDQLVASVRNNQSVTAYITGDITASTSEIIVGGSSSTCIALVIIPVGNVTITRTGAHKMFDVQEGGTLSIVGNVNEKITFDGANLTASNSMFGINNTSANFSYCDFKNTNLQDDGAVLYITDTAGNTCVNIGNCTFENNSNSDVYVQNCPSLILDGNVQIPSLYFRNEYVNSSLNIGIGDNLSGSVTIKADNYESLDVFNLSEGTVFPVDVFSLADSSYEFNTDGSVSKVESVSGGGSGSDSNITVVDVTTLESAISNAEERSVDNPYVIAVTGNSDGYIDLSETMEINSHIKLIPAGNTDVKIGRNPGITENNLFVINSNASLTLGDSSASASIIIDGGSENSMNAKLSLIKVESGGTLVLNEKSTLQNNLCYGSNGSAVYSKGGTIKIDGGVISSNQINDTTSARYGGGIYLDSGTFVMTSGKFSSNSISSTSTKKSLWWCPSVGKLYSEYFWWRIYC